MNTVDPPTATVLGEAENEVMLGAPGPLEEETVSGVNAVALLEAESFTKTRIEKLPTELGVQENVAEFDEEQPGGNPV